MKAWLITWEGAGKRAEPLDRVAGILNPLWRAQRVADIVEFLYARACYDLDEMAHRYAKVRCSNPYPAKIRRWDVIECGHNPHLQARKVKDLDVEFDPETELETITWTELARYNALTGEIQAKATPDSYTRSITGPVSDHTVHGSSVSRTVDELAALLRRMPDRDAAYALRDARKFGAGDLLICRTAAEP